MPEVGGVPCPGFPMCPVLTLPTAPLTQCCICLFTHSAPQLDHQPVEIRHSVSPPVTECPCHLARASGVLGKYLLNEQLLNGNVLRPYWEYLFHIFASIVQDFFYTFC